MNAAWLRREQRGRRLVKFHIRSFCGRGPVPQEGGGLGRAWTLQGPKVPQVPKLRWSASVRGGDTSETVATEEWFCKIIPDKKVLFTSLCTVLLMWFNVKFHLCRLFQPVQETEEGRQVFIWWVLQQLNDEINIIHWMKEYHILLDQDCASSLTLTLILT